MKLSLGLITVTTPGQTIHLSANPASARQFVFHPMKSSSPIVANAGAVYVGLISMSRATLKDVLLIIPQTQASPLLVTLPSGAIDISKLYVDADNANDGLLVSYS